MVKVLMISDLQLGRLNHKKGATNYSLYCGKL